MKKLIIIFSVLCFAAAALVLIFMPKPEKVLPPLPDANYTYDVHGREIYEGGLRQILKRPKISEDSPYTEPNKLIAELEKNDIESVDFPFEEDQSATVMINKCDVTLAAGDYISYKLEGNFINVTTGYNDFVLKAHNVDFSDGKEIGFEAVVLDMNKFARAFANGKFTMVRNDMNLDEESSVEMMTNFSPENGIFPEWYFDTENFIVIARAPSAMGGLTEYKIPLLEAEEFLNMENGLVKMIFTGK